MSTFKTNRSTGLTFGMPGRPSCVEVASTGVQPSQGPSNHPKGPKWLKPLEVRRHQPRTPQTATPSPRNVVPHLPNLTPIPVHFAAPGRCLAHFGHTQGDELRSRARRSSTQRCSRCGHCVVRHAKERWARPSIARSRGGVWTSTDRLWSHR
jgi:hypothetical protein